VKTLGSSTGSVRTDEQTEIARFFTDSPVRMWNQAFREIAEEARLFAVLNMAGADAHIGCWDDEDGLEIIYEVDAKHR
jgi:hypothetical protein